MHHVKIKFKAPHGISLPHGGVLTPNLYAKTKVVNGFTHPVPVQDYDADEIYKIPLLDEMPAELPDHLKNIDPEVKKAYQTAQASASAENHKLNQVTRNALKKYEEDGSIEIVGDSFMDSDNGDTAKKNEEWKLQDGNQSKRFDPNSFDNRAIRERAEIEPQPHLPRVAVAGDANAQATKERNDEFGGHSGVPTNEEPNPGKKERSKASQKRNEEVTSTENKVNDAKTSAEEADKRAEKREEMQKRNEERAKKTEESDSESEE